MNPIVEILKESLTTNSIYTHTDTESAEQFLATLEQTPPERANILITGDTDVVDRHQVTQCLNLSIRMFGAKENMRIITGELPGVESIVRKWAKKNGFETDIFKIKEKPEWVDNGHTDRQDRDAAMIASAHCVLILTKPNSKFCNFMYHTAISAGRFVSKRLVRSIKK